MPQQDNGVVNAKAVRIHYELLLLFCPVPVVGTENFLSLQREQRYPFLFFVRQLFRHSYRSLLTVQKGSCSSLFSSVNFNDLFQRT